FAPVVGFLPQGLPFDLPVAHPFTEVLVFATGPREDADKAALLPGDVVHVLDRGQLAVGNIKEVLAAGQLAEEIPGVAVGAVVGDVAAGDAERDGHAAVAG